jgi:hypothetical protein
MKAYLLTVLVIDHDKIGEAEVKSVLEDARYPNRCIGPLVQNIETFDIGEWSDDHPLNQVGTNVIAWLNENEIPVASGDSDV